MPLTSHSLLNKAERAERAKRLTARGMFLDSMQHGDVAVLSMPTFALVFICGAPAAKLDRRNGRITALDELKESGNDWQRDQVEAALGRRNWHYVSADELFRTLLCSRPHEAPCQRRHVTGIKPKKLLDRSKTRGVVSAS